MKKFISVLLALTLIASMFTVAASALSVSDEGIVTAKEGVAAAVEEGGEEETQRIYFQMPNGNRGAAADEDVYVHVEETDPETGEVISEHDDLVIKAGDKAPTWYSDYNVVDGKNYAGAYWWGGTAACDSWVGYRIEIDDYDQGIYYVDLPTDVVIMIFNNGVDGGMDPALPIYFEAAQTVDTNVEGAYEGDFDTLPYGSPDPDLFDGCIFIVDPNQVKINALSHKQTCGVNPYVYYGNGCYGGEYAEGKGDSDYPDGTDNWSDNMQDVCQNPDHFVDGVHVGYHEDTPVTEATTAPETTAPETEATEAAPTEPAPELDSTKLYFDASTTGWELGSKDKIGFYVFGKDGELLPWGGKKLNGTDEGNGLWSYDPAAKGMDIKEGEQYKIIFTGAGNQTYDLIFDTTCYGHIAYCDGTEYENPVDSSKKALAAFWKDIDAAKYGPVLQVSSIGNVVGTCPEEGKTPYTIFKDFLNNTLENAREFVVTPGTKTEQQLIDDIGAGLGLEKKDVADAIAETGVESTWDAATSTLPGEVPTDAPTETGTEAVHVHTPGEAVQENVVPASCKAEGSYDEVVYCTECGEEISREAKTIDKLAHTPAKAVYENVVKATCTAAGSYDAVVYCSECGEELSRTAKTLAIKAHTLSEVAEVPATYEAEGVMAHYECSVCNKLFSDAEGKNEVTAEDLVIPMLVPTEPAPVGPEYYVVGTNSSWAPDEAYKMTATDDGKYVLKDLDITATTQFKVVKVEDGAQTWMPDGMGNNYGENGEVTVPGVYDVYFDPAISTDGWFYNCIYVDGMPAPTPSTEATEPGPEPGRAIDNMPFADDVVAEAGITDTFTVYFQMPMDGDINWANEYNEIDGQNYAGVYWWQGAKNLDPWPGAKMTLVDAEQGIFSVNVPYESDVLTTIIFNNAVDGGKDKTADVYTAAHQTANINCQGYDEGESDTMPEGTATDNFDGCIFIVNPDTLDVNQFSGKDTIDGDWYFYYGDGHYGMYAEDSDNFTTVEEMCMNPAHDHGHVIPTQPVKPTEPVEATTYYVVGNMNGWAPSESYAMMDNGDGTYTYENIELTTESQFKIVGVTGDNQTWYPDGMGNNYGENGEITEDGAYDVTFSTTPQDGWFYDCIKVEPHDFGTYYLVGNMTGWAPNEDYKMLPTTYGDEVDAYVITLPLTTDSQFKVVFVKDGVQNWMPDGMGNNYGENGEITADGVYTIYFRPDLAGGDDWFYGCIKAELQTGYFIGDANGDGTVDDIDATIVQRYDAHFKVPYDMATLMNADVDGDGELTIVDATFIQRYAVGVPTPYAIGEFVAVG